MFRMLPKWLIRKKRSKGHGVHSPFAFELITKVIHSPHAYYAFYDIPDLLKENNLNSARVTPFNHLSFRLVNHFKPKNILEIHSGQGINTLFLSAAAPASRLTCVEANQDSLDVARILLQNRLNAPPKPCWRQSVPDPREGPFDAIFVYTGGNDLPSVDTLLKLGHSDTFWVIHPIRRGSGKQFWKSIVNEERAYVTFNNEVAGIVFPWPGLTPFHYWV